MSKKIFIISEHHSAESLKEILSGSQLNRDGQWVIEAEEEGVRSVTEILHFVAENGALILSLIGSSLAAWKLYIDQQKNRLEKQKLELDKRRQNLEENKFQLELMKWRRQQAELENQIPKTMALRSETGDEFVLELDLSSPEKTELELKEILNEVEPENIKGIVFE